MSEVVTMIEAARIAGVAERTIRRAVKAGTLPADLHNPKRARIRRADLERWKSGIPVEAVLEQRASNAAHVDQALLARVKELEQRVSHLERQSDKQRRKVKPVQLLEFGALHNVTSMEYRRAINMAVLPIVRRDETELLDGLGQRAFWQVFHELASFLPCGDCPH